MSINHRIGEHVTRYLVGRDYDVADVQCAKVCYAVESIVGDLQKDLVLFVIFSVSGFFREFLFCFVTVNLVRRFLGGIHMKTNIGCTVASVSVYVIAVALGCTCHISISGRSGIVAVYDVSDGDDRTITIAKSTGLQGRTKKEDSTKRLDRTRRIEYLFGDLPCLFHIYCMDFDFTDCGGRSCSDERKLFEL